MPTPLLIGIALSVGVGVGVAFIHSKSVLIGLCAVLLGLVVTLLYDLHRRVDRRIEGDDDRSVLLAALDETPWLLQDLRDIATSADIVLTERGNKTLFEKLTRAKLDETRSYMQDLQRGRIRVPAGDETPMSNQIDLVKKTVHATTIPEVDTEWWTNVAGHNYLDRNRKAHGRKVTTERIVLWEQWSENLEKVIQEQKDAKVKLLFVERAKVLDQRLLTNMAIYDETSYNEVAFNYDQKEIYVEFYLDPSDAKQALARFEKLKRYATENMPSELDELHKQFEERKAKQKAASSDAEAPQEPGSESKPNAGSAADSKPEANTQPDSGLEAAVAGDGGRPATAPDSDS